MPKSKLKTKSSEDQLTMSHLLTGVVVSAKVPQTATVLIESVKIHPLYKKGVKRSKRYLTHDLLGVKEGDVVQIVKIKPVSKNKHFQIFKKIGEELEVVVDEKLKEDVAEAIAEVMPTEESLDVSHQTSEEAIIDKKTKEKKEEKSKS